MSTVTFVLNKNKVVTTKGGHAIAFQKGVPTHVPAHAYNDVLAVGAFPSEELPEPDEAVSREPNDPSKRRLMILRTMTQMVTANRREDFTANGVPQLQALNIMLGFKIDAHERDELWLEQQKPAE